MNDPSTTVPKTRARRKRAGRSHRLHDGPLVLGSTVLILYDDAAGGISRGVIIDVCARLHPWKAATKYVIDVDGLGPPARRIVRRSLLIPVTARAAVTGQLAAAA